jgi:hypothetical protein
VKEQGKNSAVSGETYDAQTRFFQIENIASISFSRVLTCYGLAVNYIVFNCPKNPIGKSIFLLNCISNILIYLKGQKWKRYICGIGSLLDPLAQ